MGGFTTKTWLGYSASDSEDDTEGGGEGGGAKDVSERKYKLEAASE